MKMTVWIMMISVMLSPNCLAMELPTPTDLKATYCLNILNYYKKVLSEKSANESPTSQQILKETVEIAETKLQRLEAYLLPRLPYLDVTGIIFAAGRAQSDIKSMKSHLIACSQQCGQDLNCILKCSHGAESAQQMKSCQDLSFLPF